MREKNSHTYLITKTVLSLIMKVHCKLDCIIFYDQLYYSSIHKFGHDNITNLK